MDPDLSEGARPSTAIVAEVATREGVDPTELSPRLGDVVAADAIDALFIDGTADARLEFGYCGYRVTIHADDTVEVVEQRQATADEGVGSGATSDVD